MLYRKLISRSCRIVYTARCKESTAAPGKRAGGDKKRHSEADPEHEKFAGSKTHQFTGGANLISAVLVLAVMILPTVISISEASLRAVPKKLKSASLALGASRMQTIFKVLVPAAGSGIMTSVVLGCGRAIGEAMAISLVSGSSVNFLLPFHSVRFLTTAIVAEMSYSQGLHREVLFTIGLVLFIFIMFINTVLTGMFRKRVGGNGRA